MDAELRACIAYIAGRVISGKNTSSVYDHARSQHVTISGTIVGTRINVFDHTRSAHLGGTLPSLFDHGRSAHFGLNIEGNQFSGFDHGSSSHYSGTVSGGAISIFDNGTGQHYHFSI